MVGNDDNGVGWNTLKKIISVYNDKRHTTEIRAAAVGA